MAASRVLVLGANGFIGSAVLARLVSDGHEVTGLGRNVSRARQKWPKARWQAADLNAMTRSEAWRELLAHHDVVVNCAGALQDGLSDDLAAAQDQAMQALYAMASQLGGRRIVQISTRTDGKAGHLRFLATKRRADEALAASGLPHVILRPAVVLGRNAHGGSALIRALSSFPFILPLVHADSPVQTVCLDDVVDVVARAVASEVPDKADVDLAAAQQLTLAQLVGLHRSWLGLAAAPIVRVPTVFARIAGLMADVAGWLGWRSPLRSTAMKMMEQGVTQEGSATGAPLGRGLRTAQETLDAHPSGIQDLWFARLYLLKPAVILCLAVFWMLSGLIPLFDAPAAASHFSPFMPAGLAMALTLLTCAIDVALGLLVLVRRYARWALAGMLAMTFFYLGGATLIEPGLWLDPLGPLVKTLPLIALCLAALATLDER